MGKRIALIALVWALISLHSVAYGTLVSFSSDADYTWSPSGAVIIQTIRSSEPAGIMMSAEAHSTFNVKISTTNESGFTWTGYVLSLDPDNDATFIESTASSTKFETALFPDAWTLEFQAPQVVLQGEVVTFDFDIDIPDDHSYTFNLTQYPIPEPATITLLSIGGVLLLYKRTGNKRTTKATV